MRRLAREQLGIEVELDVAQPPLAADLNGETVHLRYFFCGITKGEPNRETYPEVAWVKKPQLADFEFESLYHDVVQWLIQK